MNQPTKFKEMFDETVNSIEEFSNRVLIERELHTDSQTDFAQNLWAAIKFYRAHEDKMKKKEGEAC
jgi:hypothetical protein